MEFTDRERQIIDRALDRLEHATHFDHGDGHWTDADRAEQASEVRALRARFAAAPVG